MRAEVFHDGNLNPPLSIMDDNLTRRVYDAFSLHPWVGKVRQVRKFYPARVEVELVYRKPVCMVAVQGGLAAGGHRRASTCLRATSALWTRTVIRV